MATRRACVRLMGPNDTEGGEDEAREEEPPQEPAALIQHEGLSDRLFWLLADDSAGQALVVVAAVLYGVDVHFPSTLLMVLLPALVGALLVLDHCGRVKEEVATAMNRVSELLLQSGPQLTVDRSLQLSSEDLQAAYHSWTHRIPAVKWHSLLSLCVNVMMSVAIALKVKGSDGCTWKHMAFNLPTIVLVAVQSLLAHHRAPMWAQSLAGLLGVLVLKATGAAVVAYRDPCALSLAAAHQSLPVLCFGSVLYTVFAHVVYRVDMQHFGVFSAAIFALHTTFIYLRYLIHTGGSDPLLWGLSCVTLSQAASTLGAIVARYQMAKLNMTSFAKQLTLLRRPDIRLWGPGG